MWELSPAELELTQEKIQKINDRAAKRGFTGRLELTSERVEKSRDVAGIKVTEIVYNTSITGEPPRYNGWTLLAALDWVESGVIVRAAPGVDKIDRDNLEPDKCDHCGIKRYRKLSYVVGDGTRELQVGSTCLKDFLGWSGSVSFLSESDVSDEISGFCGTGERTYTIDSVLAISWACVTEFGFVRSSEPGATRDAVSTVLSPGFGRQDKELAERIRPLADQAMPMAIKLREWILSDSFNGDNEYVQNLKVLCSGETTTYRHLGLLASVPQAYAKSLEETFIKQRELEERANEWVGVEKQKLTLTVKIKAVRFRETEYGVTTIYTMLSDTGHTFTWFSSNGAFGDDASEEFFDIIGTVKKHTEYRGYKTTVLTRCKSVN